ncbi:maleylacetoacetate isomerase [Stella humosa]|uniref:Maleylacetoacetate isomerase n=1 Tax=Stella humosa TaxID=94 RepID=A0A3N1KS58_9PROT|nr:maleylacetoacetate isomerase [Stella humosa]ROP81118.1 maleylacetoacetate isomerase [Stella humosa]BBK32463.1 maleylacetoacetate isomerase [Stella humosa]
MRLYSQTRNSAGWRVRIALHWKAVPFDYVAVSGLAPGEYRRINPQGLLPALAVGGRIVAQSAAILELLEELHPAPPLLPGDPVARAEVRAFAGLIAADLHPLNNNRVRKYLAGPLGRSPAEVDGWYRHWVAVGLASLEETLAGSPVGGPFCFGPAPTLADLHLVPQIYNCRRFGCDLAPYPRLVAADAACRDVAAFRAAAPEHLPDYSGAEPPWMA